MQISQRIHNGEWIRISTETKARKCHLLREFESKSTEIIFNISELFPEMKNTQFMFQTWIKPKQTISTFFKKSIKSYEIKLVLPRKLSRKYRYYIWHKTYRTFTITGKYIDNLREYVSFEIPLTRIEFLEKAPDMCTCLWYCNIIRGLTTVVKIVGPRVENIEKLELIEKYAQNSTLNCYWILWSLWVWKGIF